jgi:hypothetical protein
MDFVVKLQYGDGRIKIFNKRKQIHIKAVY